MSLLRRLRRDVRFVRDAARTYSILRKVRPDYEISIADFVEDVAETVRRLPSPPFLVGHSMGGFILQKYLEDHPAPGAVLLSSPPPSGLLGTTLRVARRRPLRFAKVNLTLSLLPVVATPHLAREAFFADDLPEEQLLVYW